MAVKRLRVMLNDRVLHGRRTGVGHYVAELIAGLRSADPGIDLLLFYETYLARLASNRMVRHHLGRAGRRMPRHLRLVIEKLYQAALGCAGRLRGCTLYHEPGHIPGPWPGVTLTTIHDLSVLRYPTWHPADRVDWYQREFLASLSRSDHFVAVSEFTKREMIELLGIAPEKITSIPHGPRTVFRARPPDRVSAWLARRRLPATYFLYVGTIEPRKNLDGILSAYARLPPASRNRVPLLIGGAAGWGRDDIHTLIGRHGLSAHVRALGYLEDEDLGHLYAGARALVWPTFYEGFGLPPLEAMASGTPVIAARNSSIPEVVGRAGILVDPHDVEQIRSAMQSVLEDQELAETLSAQGLQRSREFSWSRSAVEHAALYRQLAAP